VDFLLLQNDQKNFSTLIFLKIGMKVACYSDLLGCVASPFTSLY
jgi:hypothetical protein